MPSKRQRAVWAWSIDDLIRAQTGEPRSEDFRWDRWESRPYVTDIFNIDDIPSVDDLLIGVVHQGDKQVVAVGRVDSAAGISTSRMRASISPILHIEPVPIDALGITQADSRRLVRALRTQALRPRRLDDKTAREVLAALERAVPALRNWLDALDESGIEVAGADGLRLREERDAVQIGLGFADLRLPDAESALHVPTGQVQSATSFLNPELFEDNEDDLLFADLRRFDTNGVLTETSGSTSRYSDGEFTVLIANVNRKPVEHLFGVDLLYWDQTAASFTLLQYKRLSRVAKATNDHVPHRWRYTRRDELVRQLEKMAKLEVTPPVDAADWRFVTSPFWFKFVRGDAFRPNDREVLKGLYIPAEYLRIGVQQNAFVGPNGGFALHGGNARYINRDPFIHLVRRQFTGSTRATSEQIANLIRRNSDHELVVVAKTSNHANA